MNKEKLKNKCTERAKIFQQAMESCKSSSPIDCIEWFADRIVDLEKENAELKGLVNQYKASKCGSISLVNRNMIMFDQLNKAKEIIKKFSEFVNNDIEYDPEHPQEHTDLWNELCAEVKQFLSEVENV